MKIVETIAVLSKLPNGWQKEINLVKQGETDTVVDVREWSSDHTDFGAGFSMTRSELECLISQAGDWLKKEDDFFELPDMPDENEDGSSEPVSHENPAFELWYCTSKSSEVSATGYPKGDGFVVCKGSRFSATKVVTYDSAVSLRQKLTNIGVISGAVFLQDYEFKSCSTAASVVLGRSANGWVEWKNEAGKELDSIRKK